MAPTIQKDSFIKSPFLGVSRCLKGRHLTESLVPRHKLTTLGNTMANQKGRWGNLHTDCKKDLSSPFSVKSHRQQRKGACASSHAMPKQYLGDVQPLASAKTQECLLNREVLWEELGKPGIRQLSTAYETMNCTSTPKTGDPLLSPLSSNFSCFAFNFLIKGAHKDVAWCSVICTVSQTEHVQVMAAHGQAEWASL